MFSHQKGAGFLKEGKNNVSQKKLRSWSSQWNTFSHQKGVGSSKEVKKKEKF